MNILNKLENKLSKRRLYGNLRQLRTTKSLIDFASNDYLGLASSKELYENVAIEQKKYPEYLNLLGSTGSRLLTGNSRYIENLEDKIARFHGYESGLLFNCGYMANIGLLSSIADEEDIIFFDLHVHASMHDGMHLNGAKCQPFRHNDIFHLEERLKKSTTKGSRFICIESIYSTDGSKAPIQEISDIAKKYDARLIIDEAHATGVYGPSGRGCIAELNLMKDVFAHIITFGKALGTHGAIVLGTQQLKDYLINFASPCIYTTALPFTCLTAIQCSYDLFPQMDAMRDHLFKLIRMIQQYNVNESKTHIQSIKIKGNNRIASIAQLLAKENFDVRALMSPTVQRNHEALRICLHAFNTESELKMLIERVQYYLDRTNE